MLREAGSLATNATPVFDSSVNTTGCCAKFNPEGWDGQALHFEDKRFVRATTRSVAHIPLNMGRVFSRVLSHIAAAGAEDPSQSLALSRDISAFSGEHLIAVTKDVPEEEMVSLSGDFLTKTFEGPYSQARHWYGEMQQAARDKGHEPGNVWFYYTTCPNCAKAYGANPVVGVVELVA
jgi:hypothetical protein